MSQGARKQPAEASEVDALDDAEETTLPEASELDEPEALDPDEDDEDDSDDSIIVVGSESSTPVGAVVATEPGSSSAPAITAYMAQLRHHAPISREEEHELAVKWVEHGDLDAAKKLVVSNLRLVVKIAMEYRRAWANTLDLIQEGNVGLMEAVQRYDPYQGVKLSSYAVYWIRAFILKYILDNMRSVRMGTTRAQRKLFFRLNREKRALERQGYEASPKLIAERLDVSEDDVIDMEARLSRPDLSTNAPARRDESDGATVGDMMATPGVSAEDQVGDSELREVFLTQVAEFAQSLSDRDKQILEERLLAAEPRTLADMGEEFGVSRERVRQLEARLIKRMREHLKANMVDFEFYEPEGE